MAIGGGSMPADIVQTYRAFAYNNAWANHRLLTACGGLGATEFAAPRIGFFPSLQATLNHILTVDWFYTDALEGGTLGPKAWQDELPCPDLAGLTAAQRAVDARLVAVCDGLSPEALDATVMIHRGTSIQRERCDRLLMHLFQHQIHHRGQAHAMLAGTGVAPPQLDEFFFAAEAPLRAPDFSALGWREEMIWKTRGSTLPKDP